MNTEALPKPTSDTQHTLLALITWKTLTSVQLRKLTKSSYPAARIFDLSKAGLSIFSKPEKYTNRRGKVTNISRYFLQTPTKEAKKIYKQLVKG